MTMITLNYLRERVEKLDSICEHCLTKGKNCNKTCYIGKKSDRLMSEIRKGFDTVEEKDESAE